MDLNQVIYIDSLPTIDLHGFDRDYARIKINEFINDNLKLGNMNIAIIHGRGSGILKEETNRTLKNNKNVEDFRLFYNNVGVTIVKLTKI